MRPTGVLLLLLVAAVACEPEGVNREAGVPSAPVSVDPSEPCDLLVPADIERVLGAEVSGEREVGSHDLVTRICRYKTTRPWTSVGVVVEENVTRQAFERRMSRDEINTEPTEGLGDGAFIHACVSLSVLVGNVVASLSVQHFTTCDETAAVLRALARQAVVKLEAA